MPAVKVFIFLLGLILLVDVAWLNSRVVDLGKQIPAKLKSLEEQITFLGYQQDQRTKTATVGEPIASPGVAVNVVPTSAPKSIVETRNSVTREVFIPLGSGSTSSTEWTDTGAQAYVDTAVYPNWQVAYLQASLKSNSGGVFARLVQKNENAVVPGSDISHNTTISTFKTSAKALLSEGNKLYLVQLRSETGQEVFVENARLRLVLK